LARAVPNAQVLDQKLKKVFTLPENGLRLDSVASAPREPKCEAPSKVIAELGLDEHPPESCQTLLQAVKEEES